MDHNQSNNLPMVIEGGDLEYAGDLPQHHHPSSHPYQQQQQQQQHQVETPQKSLYDPASAAASNAGGGYYYQQHPTPIPQASSPLKTSHPGHHSGPPATFSKEDGGEIPGTVRFLKPRTLLLITTALLILLIAAVALVGGLLGSKIAKLEKNVSPSSTTTNDGNSNSSTPTATGPQPAFTTNTRITGFRYVGCYVDANDRVLRQHSFQANNMTNQICAGACTERANYKYFGTESGDQCYCGDSLPEGVADLKANEWNCGMGCAGSQAKKQEICGGNYFVGIWERV